MYQAARFVIEGGREHDFADTIFEVPPDYSGEEIGPGARIGVLRIRLAPDARDIDWPTSAQTRSARLEIISSASVHPCFIGNVTLPLETGPFEAGVFS